MQATETKPATVNLRMNLEAAVAELRRRLQTRVDVVGDSRDMTISCKEDGSFRLHAKAGSSLSEWVDSSGVPVLDSAINQLLERCDVAVPSKFGRAVAQAHPKLAGGFLTELLQASGQRRFVRMLDGNVRAFLSDKYLALDNYEIAGVALGVAKEVGAECLECFLTPETLRLRLVRRDVWEEVATAQRDVLAKTGQLSAHSWLGRVGGSFPQSDLPGGPGTVHPLVDVFNSETGHGGCGLDLGTLTGICLNSSILSKAFRKVHMYDRMDEGVLVAETLAARAKAVMLTLRDYLRGAFDPEKLKGLIADVVAASKLELPVKAARPALENVVQAGLLTQGQIDDVFAYFVKDYQPTVWGLSSAMSRLAEDTDDAKESLALEEAAGALVRKPELALAAVAA